MMFSQRQAVHGPTGLRRFAPHAKILALCAVIGGLAGLGVALLAPDRYTAETTLLLRTPAIDNGIVASAAPPSQDERPYRTHVELLTASAVEERARERLRTAGLSDPAGAVDAVDIKIAGDSNLAVVDAQAAGPRRAVRISDEYARAYLDVRRASVRSRLSDLATALERRANLLVDRGGTGISGVQRRADMLRTLASVEPADAQILRLAPAPREAADPPFLRNAIAGLVAGLLVGLVLASLRARRTRRVRSIDELEDVMGVPVLAGVPRSRFLDGRTMPGDLPVAEAETFRMLRANLLHMDRGNPVRSVLVTSAQAGEGKSLVALNLAAALAATGHEVLLVEADVRDPSISRLLGVAAGDGLAEVLLGDRPIDDVVRQVPAPAGGGERHTFDVLAAGLARVHAVELLDTDRMRAMLVAASDRYDAVVVDTAPMGLVSDGIPLLDQVDAVVAVARIGRIPLAELLSLRALFERTNARFVGVVANFIDPRPESDYGAYGTAYAAPAVRSVGGRNGQHDRAQSEVITR
jgi:capsular exopolysaccharide synthesis family protein